MENIQKLSDQTIADMGRQSADKFINVVRHHYQAAKDSVDESGNFKFMQPVCYTNGATEYNWIEVPTGTVVVSTTKAISKARAKPKSKSMPKKDACVDTYSKNGKVYREGSVKLQEVGSIDDSTRDTDSHSGWSAYGSGWFSWSKK
jgi:hypothetical protein